MPKSGVFSCVFGIARPSLSRDGASTMEFASRLTEHTGIDVVAAHVGSYDELGVAFGDGRIHIAWLPPIPFLAMHHAGLAIPLVSHERSGATTFTSVLIVREESPITTLEQLNGARAAWTDPLSASGFVLPRLHIAGVGLNPKALFASETFYGSHELASEAVASGKADVAGTYARFDDKGLAVSGGWSSAERAGVNETASPVRILHRFERVPSDVIAAHRSVAHDARAAIAQGLIEMAKSPDGASLCRSLFGVDGFSPWSPGEHDALRKTMAEAALRGVLDSVDVDSDE